MLRTTGEVLQLLSHDNARAPGGNSALLDGKGKARKPPAIVAMRGCTLARRTISSVWHGLMPANFSGDDNLGSRIGERQ